jgi:hypothetical protein
VIISAGESGFALQCEELSMPDAINLAEASPEELKKIQHSAVRALALALGSDDGIRGHEEDLTEIHLSIVFTIWTPPPNGDQYTY